MADGAAVQPAPERVPVRLSDGRVGTIAPADLKETIAQGGQVISPDAFVQAQHAAKSEEQYGGFKGAFIAEQEGALRGLTMGLSDPAIIEGARAFGGDEAAEAARQHLAGYAGENRAADFLGQAGGMVAGAAAVPLSPAGVAEGLGAAAEGGVGRVVGKGVVGRAVSKAASGAVVGGLAGAGQVFDESALGGTQVSAEKVVAGAGTGAFLGGATAGLFSLAGSGAGAARDEVGRYLASMQPKQIESLAEKQFGYAPEGLGSKISRWYSKSAALASGADEEAISALTKDALKPGSAGARARQIAVYDAPSIQEQAQKAIRYHADQMLDASYVLTEEAKGGLKASQVERAVKTGNENEVAKIVREQVQSLITGAEAQLTKGAAPQMVKSIESVSKAAYRVEAELAAGGDNAKAFIALDNLKRDLQRMTSNGYRAVPNISDPIDMRAARDTVEWLDKSAESVRKSLEDTAVWGKAAEQQQAINEAWTRQIDAGKRFHRALTTEVGRDSRNPYLQVRGVDPAKAETYVKNLTNPNQDLTHLAVRDYVESTQDLAQAIKRSYELAPDKLAQVDRIEGAAKAFGSTLNKAEESLVLANQFRKLTERDPGSVSGMLGTLGFALGGAPGGAIGTALGAVKNPARTIAQLAAAERMIQKVDARVGSSIRGFFGSATPKALPAASEVATEKGFAKTVAQVTSWQAEPEKLAQQMGRSLGELPHAAPNLSTAMTVQASRVAKFLYDKLPVGMTDPYSLNPAKQDLLVSEAEREQYAVYHRAALEPDSVFRSLEHGMVTPEEAEALQVCWPNLFAEAQEQIRAEAGKRELPYEKEVQLGVLFDVPTVPELAPDVMAATARSYAYVAPEDAAPGPASASTKPLNLARAFATSFSAAARNDEGD